MTRFHRERIIRSLLDPAGRGLEIGPGYNPLFPKARGHCVKTVDHLATEDLRQKYREMGRDASRIEEVDSVWRGEPLHELVRDRGVFDFIFASHVLEHLPDPVSFFHSCDLLLNERGVLVLAVPDKRFCFDAFRPIASTGDLLQAHLERRTRHPPGKLFDQAAYHAERRGRGTWHRRTLGPILVRGNPATARAEFDRATGTAEYVDNHGWQFVPSSLRLVLHDLSLAGLTSMKEVAFRDPRGLRDEFLLALARWGPGCPVERTVLCRRVLREQREGLDDLWNSCRALLSAAWAAALGALGREPW